MPSKLPDTITRNAMAALLQVTPQRVSQLTALGVLKRASKDGYIVTGSVGAYADFRAEATAKRRHQDSMAGIKQRQLERIEAQIRREDAQLITISEALEFGDRMIAKFLEAYRSIPGRLDTGSALRKSLESAMPGYVAELDEQLREPMKTLRAGGNIRGV